MSYDGNGNYSLPGPAYPAIPGNVILAEEFNEIVADIAAALSLALTRDGQATVTGTIDFGNQGMINLATIAAASVIGLTMTGAIHVPTQPNGTNNDLVASCAFVTQTAMQAALPALAGQAGLFLTNDGVDAYWAQPIFDFLLQDQGII